jgi:hypothetical protein
MLKAAGPPISAMTEAMKWWRGFRTAKAAAALQARQYAGKMGSGPWRRTGETRMQADDGDSGSAARFFYCAKATTDERGEGNNHPTVKPVALMRWLVRLVTPKGGTVLDPFMGSGSTGSRPTLSNSTSSAASCRPNMPAIAEAQIGSERVPGKTNGAMKAVSRGGGPNAFRGNGANRPERDMAQVGVGENRNKRSVWEVATQPFSEAHFATYPPALIEPCILAGCPKDGTVLDPFGGAGTTGLVADRLQRNAILIELNPEYAGIAERRLGADAPLFAQVRAA